MFIATVRDSTSGTSPKVGLINVMVGDHIRALLTLHAEQNFGAELTRWLCGFSGHAMYNMIYHQTRTDDHMSRYCEECRLKCDYCFMMPFQNIDHVIISQTFCRQHPWYDVHGTNGPFSPKGWFRRLYIYIYIYIAAGIFECIFMNKNV